MSNQASGADQSSRLFNTRLPQLTPEQIDRLSATDGLTEAQLIIVAVDWLVRSIEAEAATAQNDVRRLKTVARISPQFDLGQED